MAWKSGLTFLAEGATLALTPLAAGTIILEEDEEIKVGYSSAG
jgi:hypothetical protein